MRGPFNIQSAHVRTQWRNFDYPIVLGNGTTISNCVQARVQVAILLNGRCFAGQSTGFLTLWSWLSDTLSAETRTGAMIGSCRKIARLLPSICGDQAYHPLEAGSRLLTRLPELDLPENPPMLARLLCAGLFDNAVHDAFGYACQRSALEYFGQKIEIPSLDDLFTEEGGAIRAISNLLRPEPITRQLAWLVIGPREDDKTIAHWVRLRGYTAVKLKLGPDPVESAKRTIHVANLYHEKQGFLPLIGCDPNCSWTGLEAVETFFDIIETRAPHIFPQITYLEQPTSRELIHYPVDWRRLKRRKHHVPLVLDEGLASLQDIALAAEQGWNEISAKYGRGLTFTLASCALAKRYGLGARTLDLTCPGQAMYGNALLAAYLPGYENGSPGCECNVITTAPSANDGWPKFHPPLFDFCSGHHELTTILPGLGGRMTV